MKFKKFFALAIAVIMLCTAIVSVGAASFSSSVYYIDDVNTNVTVAKVRYTLQYYSGANCVRATNAITYYSIIHESQRNFPGYINLTVTMNTSSWNSKTAGYLHTTYNYYELISDYYIPSGYVFASASAYYSTNDDSNGYYANYNYSWVETSTDLVVTP